MIPRRTASGASDHPLNLKTKIKKQSIRDAGENPFQQRGIKQETDLMANA